MRKIYCTECKKYKELKKLKISYICDKTLLLVFVISVVVKMKKHLKKKNQLKRCKSLV